MKFLYAYRDSQNERHDGEIKASSKDDAFKILRSQGIKPFFVTLAPGLGNRLASFGFRVWSIVVLAIALVLTLVYFTVERGSVPAEESSFLDASMRRQVIGDSAIIEKGIQTGWSDIFQLEGDRFLASFAIPGVEPAIKSTTEENLEKALRGQAQPSATTSSSIEARQILAIVAGMKDELRGYLKAGGSFKEYGAELVARQEAEKSYRERAKIKLEMKRQAAESPDRLLREWEDINRHLRGMGIKPLSMEGK